MKDPYETLGVRRSDSEDTIRKAYRKLAKRHHPDMNPGKPEAADRFKDVNAAHDLLSDPERRAKYDRGEIDAEGNQTAPPSWRHADAAAGGRHTTGAARSGGGGEFAFDDLDSLFGHAFGPRQGSRPGIDMSYTLTLDFTEAAKGTVRRLTLPEGRTLDVTIPSGVRDGHILRLRGQGRPGSEGGPAGDALVEITIALHKHFRREGDDVVLRLPVSLQEAVLGATVEVPTIRGFVRLAIPPNSQNGARLRLRGRGIGDGHQFVELLVTLPPEPEPALDEFLRNWKPQRSFNPRADLA